MNTTGIPQALSGTGAAIENEAVAGQPAAERKAGGMLSRLLSRHLDRDAFRLRLQQHYHQHAVNDTPFLLIAMRGDGNAARSLDFPLLYDCVHQLLDLQDDWFADLQNKRLIVLLAEGRLHDAHRFFARLKRRLLQDVPHKADVYLNAFTAIVVPDGGRFQNAEDFLTVALEEQ